MHGMEPSRTRMHAEQSSANYFNVTLEDLSTDTCTPTVFFGGMDTNHAISLLKKFRIYTVALQYIVKIGTYFRGMVLPRVDALTR